MLHYFDSYYPDFQNAAASFRMSGRTKKTASVQ